MGAQMYARIKRRLTAAIVSILTIAAPTASQAVTFVLDDTNLVLGSPTLIGVNSLDVNGVFYDVTLHDLTCLDLYNGCDDAFFPFETPVLLDEFAAAEVAMEALRTQMNDVFGGASARVTGCALAGGVGCFVAVPYFAEDDPSGVIVTDTAGFFAGAGGSNSVVTQSAVAFDNDTVWTTWELSATQAVPLPAPFWLLGSTFVFLFGMRAIRLSA